MMESEERVFGREFWVERLRELRYPVKVEELDVPTLMEQRALPKDLSTSKVLRLYSDDYVEVALVELGRDLSRGLCTRAARMWKENRLGIRPLLLFTDGKNSYAVIVPGKGLGGEVKVLGLSDRLYRTDYEVLGSMRFPGDVEALRVRYDSDFFPYDRVRREFFEGYRDLYQELVKIVERYLGERSSAYAQRFLGRLMFLYFLQRKRWLRGDTRFVDTIKDYGELNTLFYESLNREGTPGIPFLNGSLFEREDYMDGALERRLKPEMDRFFEKARVFFNEYNFTVDELSSLEVEVSIDPALLGTVLENMLLEKERGEKGTFYTPRNESSFICRRALANYLGLRDEVRPSKDGREEFVDGLSEYIRKLGEKRNEREVRDFKEKLLSLKVLDPAVGSGGFLLVMMQEMIGLIHEAEETIEYRTITEELKEKILPNLYGFDIELEAVEIARLRLWLSLIIDQKEPEPLPNLDMNVMSIKDSLSMGTQMNLDLYTKYDDLRQRTEEIRSKYLNEHDAVRKKILRDDLLKSRKEFAEKTGIDPDVIEFLMAGKADVVVMNPPYVRQESIPKARKEYYVMKYGLDKKSDIYAYFLVRALNLLSDNGVTSVIASDKWLETGYGISLQRKLKDYIIAIYGQRERSFGADINTAIVVYGKEKRKVPIQFTYVETYGGSAVRRSVEANRGDLKLGKWFYLRAPKVFLEQILPRMTHKLSDFADIKRGFTTGANDFFYMKDISYLYEVDYLANPKKFEEWGVKAKNKEDLDKQGLIYFENEGGEKFVIDRKDVSPIVRSPKELGKYSVTELNTLCLHTDSPGRFTAKYVEMGENKTIQVKGKNRTWTVKGYQNIETIKNRKPWFKLAELKPSHIILPMSTMDKLFIPYSEKAIICDARFNTLNSKIKTDYRTLWMYLNSTIFLIVIELFCRRLGGAASDIKVEDYEIMPVPHLENLNIDCKPEKLLNREVLRYYEEIKQDDRKELDIAVLKTLGFDKPEKLLGEIYNAFLEVVDDRLIKADRLLRRNKENDDEEVFQE